MGEGRPSTPLVPLHEGKAWVLGLRRRANARLCRRANARLCRRANARLWHDDDEWRVDIRDGCYNSEPRPLDM